MQALQFTVADLGGRPIISVEGEVDLATAADLLEMILTVHRVDDRDVLVDFAGVTFLDSTGIAALVQAHKLMREKECRLRLTNTCPHVATVLEVTGVDRMLMGVDAPA